MEVTCTSGWGGTNGCYLLQIKLMSYPQSLSFPPELGVGIAPCSSRGYLVCALYLLICTSLPVESPGARVCLTLCWWQLAGGRQ